MSDMAKAARAAMRGKARRFASADPHKKVDASSWTPPADMKTEAKTGLRPISRRQFRRGGKVGMHAEGDKAKVRADRKQRRSGGSATEYANAKINRNVRAANSEIDKPQVGGYRKGGRAHKMDGGLMDPRALAAARMAAASQQAGVAPSRMGFARRAGTPLPMSGMKKGGKTGHPDVAEDKALIRKMVKSSARTGKADGGYIPAPARPSTADVNEAKGILATAGGNPQDRTYAEEVMRNARAGRKHGGRTRKADGGDLGPNQKAWLEKRGITAPRADTRRPEEVTDPEYRPLAQRLQERQDVRLGMPPAPPAPPMPSEPSHLYGGARKASLRKQIMEREKMLREQEEARQTMRENLALQAEERREKERRGPSGDELARTVEQRGESYLRKKMAEKEAAAKLKKPSILKRLRSAMGLKHGGAAHPAGCGCRTCRGEGGRAGDIGGERPQGGRAARKSGGRTGKSKINIIIAAGQPGAQQPPMIPGMMGPARPPMGLPVPVPSPAAGGAGAAPAPMPMPVPMPMPAGGPMAGPMGRKTGGRVGHRKYRSYKDMDAGAGSGLGRLEKTEIEANK